MHVYTTVRVCSGYTQLKQNDRGDSVRVQQARVRRWGREGDGADGILYIRISLFVKIWRLERCRFCRGFLLNWRINFFWNCFGTFGVFGTFWIFDRMRKNCNWIGFIFFLLLIYSLYIDFFLYFRNSSKKDWVLLLINSYISYIC